MKVLLKSLEELKLEYGIEEINGYLIIGSGVVATDMVKLFGKVVEARYDEKSDSYVIDDWYFHPNLIKGEVINEEITYTIKRLSDGKEYTLSL